MADFKLPCGCTVDRNRPEHLTQLCPPHLDEFVETHTRALEDYRKHRFASQPLAVTMTLAKAGAL